MSEQDLRQPNPNVEVPSVTTGNTQEFKPDLSPELAIEFLRKMSDEERGPFNTSWPFDVVLSELTAALKSRGETLDALEQLLGNVGGLLARIHRDGGHHEEAVGTDQAIKDADAKVVRWLGIEDELTAALKERDELREKVETYREELRIAQSNNHARNIELDALHYVWCDGGCKSGVHRFGEHPELTADIVVAAERNAVRLRRWYVNRSGRDEPPVYEERLPTWLEAERTIHGAYIKQSEAELAELVKERDTLKQELTAAKQREVELRTQVETWFSRARAHQSGLDAANLHVAKLEQQLSDLRKALQSYYASHNVRTDALCYCQTCQNVRAESPSQQESTSSKQE